MVVTHTGNIGLAKPDDTELAKDWTNGPAHAVANNILIVAQAEKTLTAYSPVMVGAITNGNIGTGGSLFGEYQDLQGIIMGQIVATFGGTGVSGGSGEICYSLPLVVDPVFHTVGGTFNAGPGNPNVVGEGYVYDASATATSGIVAIDVVTVSGVSYARMISAAFTSPAKTAALVNDNQPFVPASGDRHIINFMYKKQ